MKASLLATLSLVLAACGGHNSGSTVQSDSSFAPDMYTCTTDDGLSVAYSTTSLAGQPSLQVNESAGDAGISLVNAQGQAVVAAAKLDGSMKVSVSQYIPDLQSTVWELALPAPQLSGMGDAASFQTVLKETISPSSIVGPLPSQHPTVNSHHAACVATYVAF